MPKLFFVTPAYRRYEVSQVCFAHRAWCMEQMQAAGIDARCVVIADDENIDLAQEFGFDTVEHPKDRGYYARGGRQFIGRKFNDGYEYAARQGADYVVPIGSDSWIHPSFFGSLPVRAQVQTSSYYAIVNEDGDRLARLEIPVAGGVGPNVIPTFLMRKHNYRPIMERLVRGCDTSLMGAIGRRGLSFKWVDIDPLQYFAFRVRGQQLNPFERLLKYAVGYSDTPWEDLALLHPSELVYRGRAIYQRVAAVA